MVGFEQNAYSIAEGESLEICVTIISPDDIGSTRVFLEVLPDEDAAENEAENFASKPDSVSHNEVVVCVGSLTSLQSKEASTKGFLHIADFTV